MFANSAIVVFGALRVNVCFTAKLSGAQTFRYFTVPMLNQFPDCLISMPTVVVHCLYMSLVVRKLVFGVSDRIRHKPGCTATEDGQRLEIPYLGSRGIVLSVVKTKALISFAVTAKLICIFVFAYAKSRFSHDAAHI